MEKIDDLINCKISELQITISWPVGIHCNIKFLIKEKGDYL